MKPSSIPPIPKWQRAKDSIWLQYLIVFFLLFLIAMAGVGIGNAGEVEATQPDPRIEWVTVDVGGMRLQNPDSSYTSTPLPTGTWICVPTVVRHSPPSRKDV